MSAMVNLAEVVRDPRISNPNHGSLLPPFPQPTASKLMNVGGDLRLLVYSHGNDLPPSQTTRNQLIKLNDDINVAFM